MKFLSSERLSQHKYKTPEGYLICVDAILARTGKQTYRKNEVFADSEDDSEIEVDRKPEEVFSPTTLASFENKPITVEHPDEDVNAGNYNELSVGFVRDVHKGVAEGQEVMLGTLVITDAQTIEEIENGEHTDLSCGYDCDIIDEENPQQRNIRGNHVALCQCGRAGIARIVDSKKVKDNDLPEVIKFLKQNLFNFNVYSNKINFDSSEEMRNAIELLKIYDYKYRIYNSNSIIVEDSKMKDSMTTKDKANVYKFSSYKIVEKLPNGYGVAQTEGDDLFYVFDKNGDVISKSYWHKNEAIEVAKKIKDSIKDSKYIVHFKHKNGGEDKDIVVEAKGMTEAVEIAKTYVSDYYYKYVNVKPYYMDSVKDADVFKVDVSSAEDRDVSRFITEAQNVGFTTEDKGYTIYLKNGNRDMLNKLKAKTYTIAIKFVDSVKDTEYRIVNYNNNWYYEIKQDDGFTKLVGPYNSKDEAKKYFIKHRPNEKLKDAQSIIFRGENTFIFANKDMIPERTHYKGDVEYEGKHYYYHEGFDTKRKYLVPINDSTDNSIDRNKIEQIIKSRQFELRKNGNKIQEYVYKGKEEDKKYNFEELAKALPANVGLALSGDALSVAFRDALIQSSSEEAFKKNIATEIRSGKSPEQAAAIAYSIKRKNDSKKYEVSYVKDGIEHIQIIKAKSLKEAINKVKGGK